MANVPRVPGVPNLSSYSIVPAALLLADQVGALLGFQRVIWGIYFNGFPIIDFDSFLAMDLRQDNPISDYPVELGGFQSYDKVQLPIEIRVRLAAGGSVASRALFLQSIEAVMNTVDLYDIVTPERVYLGYNFTHRDFRRAADQGNGLITVDLWLTEVRESQQAAFVNTQTPSGAGQQNIGNVQPQGGTGTVTIRSFSGVKDVQ
jgi:hypothetical protein